MEDMADEMMAPHQHRRREALKKTAHMKKVLRLAYAMRCLERKPKRQYSISQSALKETFEKELPKPAATSTVRRSLYFSSDSAKPKKDNRTRCLVNVAPAGLKKRSCGKKTTAICIQCNVKCCPDHRSLAPNSQQDFLCSICKQQ